MKRNETVLVYAVTGLLLVILLIAVVFGDDGLARAETERRPPQLAELAGISPAAEVDGGGSVHGAAEVDASEVGGTRTDPASKDPASANSASRDPAAPGPAASGQPGSASIGPVLPASTLPAPPTTLNATVSPPESRLEGAIGASRRIGAYRVVQSRRGDSLRTIAERWCGDAGEVAMVEVLNEALVGRELAYGQEVMVPWVEAEPLLDAHQARAARAAKLERVKGELYTLKRGDSLWNLAKDRVAKNRIPAWLDRFKQLNPEITNPGVLAAGQKVRLPRTDQRKP